jgi:hypothetical protein
MFAFPGMRIDSFVFNWADHAPAAERLVAMLYPLSSHVHVINSGPPRSGWVNLDAHSYFTAKWHAALERFDADVLFNVQADVTVPDMAAIFAMAWAAFRGGDVGVYAPDVEYAFWSFDPAFLPRYADGLHAAPLAEALCWFLAADVVRRSRYPTPKVNRFGWGIDLVTAATSLRLGLRVVRDYRCRVDHPKGSGYPPAEASDEMHALFRADPATEFLYQTALAMRARHQHPSATAAAAHGGASAKREPLYSVRKQ